MLVQGWGHIVFGVTSVDRTYGILKARGGEAKGSASATNDDLHLRAFHFPDSEGNWLEIYQDLPAAGQK